MATGSERALSRRGRRLKRVVITGASSGIGRALAHELARRGAAVVLTARDAAALADVVRECQELGGKAIAVTADTTRDQEVAEVARTAVAELGGFDAWVNDAAVYLMGTFDEIPPDVVRRAVDTNIIGYFNGARAALRHFRQAGRGVLINVASLNGAVPQPYSSVYVATKYAVRGWSASLRMEMSLAGERDIHICTVLPAAVDTPIFQHAANYTRRPLRALDPTYRAATVARSIANLVDKPRAEVFVGSAARVAAAAHAAAPRRYEKTMARYTDRDHFERGTTETTEGNLFEPIGPKSVSGGWR